MKKLLLFFGIVLAISISSSGQITPNCQPTITNACTPFFPMGPPSFYINNFTLNGISSSSACSTPPNTNTTIFASSNLIGGTSYPFSISTFTFFPPFGFSHSIWLDANDDGDFNDPNEQLLQSTGNFSPLLNGNITIPASSVSGLVHLRVISSSMPIPISDPCGNYSDSEVEDYVVQIQALSPCQPTISSNSPLSLGSNIELTCTSADSYSWTGPNGFTSTAQNPTIPSAELANSGIYTVTVTTGTCTATATTNVVVNPPAVLVAHYPFCGNANDVTSNANNGTVNGATLTTDHFGNANSAYSFDGINNYITVPNSTALQFGTGDFTVNYWLKTASNLQGILLSKTQNDGVQGISNYFNYPSNGVVYSRYDFGEENHLWTSDPLNNNIWHMVTNTRQGNNIKIYIDGVLKVTKTTSSIKNINNSNHLVFGANNSINGEWFNGSIDNIKFYSGILTNAEILAEFNSTTGCESGTCIPVISSNSPLCEGGNLNLQSSTAASYLWEGSNGFVSTDQNPTLANITVLGSGIYTLTVTNGSGCTGTATTEITVYDNSVCTGLIGHYKLDGNANDASGNNLHGIISGTLNTSNDRFGNASGAMHFDGNVANFIEVADNPLFRPSNITLSAWVKSNHSGFQAFVGKLFGTCIGNSWQLGWDGGSINAWSSYDQNNPCAITLANSGTNFSNIWTHYVQVIDTESDLLKLYINGALASTTPYNSEIAYDQGSIFFGKDIDNGGPFGSLNGDLDDVRIYGSAFTNQEVLDLYNFVPCEASILANSTTLCEGNTLELSAPPTFSYSWTGPNGFGSTNQNPTIPNISPLATGVYSLSMTDGISCTSTASIAITVNPTTTCEGLIAYYKLDGDANDFSGNNLHGTINGTLNPTTDIHGNPSGALHFDGNGGNYITVNDNPLLRPNNVTLSVWVKVSSSAFQSFISKVYGTSSSNSWQLGSYGGKMISWVGNSISTVEYLEQSPAPYNRWVNLVSVIDTDNDLHKLYLNGILITSAPFTGDILYDNQSLYLGIDLEGFGLANALDGDLDEVKIFGSTFSDNEVTELYESNCGMDIANNNISCSGETLNLFANAASSYSWTGPNGFTSSVQNPTIENVTTAATGTYTLVAVLGTCTVTTTTAVTINQSPVAPVVSGETEVCYGQSTVLTAECPANTTVIWSNQNGNNLGSGPTLTTFEIFGNGSSITNYYVAYCENNLSGCRSEGTNIEVSLAAFLPSISINSNYLCKGQTLNLSSTKADSYSWSGPNGFTSNLQNAELQNISIAGGGIYTLTVTDAGCTLTATTQIYVREIVLNSNAPTFEGGTLFLFSEFNINDVTIFDYSWTGPNGFSSSLQNPIIEDITISNNGVYTLIANAGICISTSTITVSINPIASISNNSPICAENSLNFTTISENNIAGLSGLFEAENMQYVEASPTFTNNILSGIYSNLPSDNFTIEMWIKTSQTDGGLFYNGDANLSTYADKHIFIEDGYLKTRILPLPEPGLNSNILINDDTWHHIAVTQKSTENEGTKIYVDGVLAVQSPNSSTCIVAPKIYLGVERNLSWLDGNYIQYFDGLMDNVKVWNLAKSATEIQNGMYAENSTSPNLVYIQKFNNSISEFKGSAPNGIAYSNANIPQPFTYSWTGPNEFVDASQNPIINNAQVNQSGIYTLTVNAGGFESILTTSVTVNPLPTVEAGSNSPICAGTTLNLTGSGGTTYTWTGPNSFTSTDQNPIIANAAVNNSGTYSVTVTDANSCSSTAQVVVVVNPLPTVEVVSNSPICAGATLNLTASGGTTYTWTGPNSFTSTDQNPIIANAAVNNSGTYSVTVTDANSCSSTAQVVVVVNPLPTVEVVSNSPICAGATLNLTASDGTNYAWTGPNGFTSTDQNPSISNAVVTNSGTYSVTVTDANSCSSTAQVVVVVNPLPIVEAGSNSPICAGTPLNLTTSGGTTYAWIGPNSFTSSDQNPSIVNAAVNNAGTYSVTVTDANSCSSTAQVVVVVNALPTVEAGSNSPICAGTPLNLTASGGATYTWTGPNSFTSTDQNPSIANAAVNNSGTYSVAVTDANSCSSTAQVVVVVNPLPTVEVGSNSPICAGTPLNLTASGGTTYAWTGPNSFTSSDQNPIIANAAVNNSGTYSVTVTDANSCSSTAQVVVVVNPLPTVEVGSNSPICAGASLNLTASSGTNYAWTGPNGFTSADQNPSILNALVNNSGTYSVTVTDANSCVSFAQVVVVVNPLPTVVASSNSPICAGTTLNLTASSGTSYAWTGPNGFASNLQNPNIANTVLANTGTYSLTVMGNNSCNLSTTILVTINGSPNLAITNPAPAVLPTTADITAPNITIGSTLPNGTVLSYHTDPAGLVTLSNPNQISIGGIYYIKAANGNCSVIKPVTVIISSNSDCNQVINLISTADDYSSGTQLKTSNLDITAKNKVTNIAKVTIRSNKSISLLPGTSIDPGFKAQPSAGGYFKAEIGGCN